MKNSINIISCIIMVFALNACSDKMDDPVCFDFDELLETYQNVCPSVTDAIEIPDFWINTNPYNLPSPTDETVRSTSTCGLLVTLLEYPLGVFLVASSNLFEPRVSMFNNELRSNKVAVEFFKRGNFYPVLVSKYLSVIKKNIEWGGRAADSPYYIQWLLASDMCMSAMNKKEKIQLMVIALERTKYALDMENQEPCLIMISIMKSFKYAPFMKDIEPRLIETIMGYAMLKPGVEPMFYEYAGYTMYYHRPGEVEDGYLNVLSSHSVDMIIKYAKQFLNEQK